MTSTSPVFVLVPGAWHGGWAWQPVARRLREAGRAAVTVTLPGLADGDERTGLRLSDGIGHVVAEVGRRGLGEVILVGHSWGGYVITGAAHQLAGRLGSRCLLGGVAELGDAREEPGAVAPVAVCALAEGGGEVAVDRLVRWQLVV